MIFIVYNYIFPKFVLLIKQSHLVDKKESTSDLPVNRSWGLFFRKYHFSPVKNIKKCRGRDLNSISPVKNLNSPLLTVWKILPLIFFHFCMLPLGRELQFTSKK